MAEKQKHVVNVTISDPNHTMVSKRKEKISRRATVSADSKESAVQGALRFYRKQGLKVHDHDYVGLKEEVEQMDEMDKSQPAAGRDSDTPFPKSKIKLTGKQRESAKLMTGQLLKHAKEQLKKEEVEQTDEAIKPKSKEDEGEYGYEGDMAMSQLRSIIRNSQAMLDNLDEKTDLPEWVQSKITLAKDYIETSANYLMSELEEGWREDKANNSYGQNTTERTTERRSSSDENKTRRAFIDAMKSRKKLRESAEQNDKIKKVMDKYKGIRNKVNTKPELQVSLRNTSPTIMGNVAGHEGQKPNANF